MDPQNPFLSRGNHEAEHEDSQEVIAERAIANAGQSQALFNYNQKLLEQKERELMESIAMNYGRIREVERELGNLQLQLKLTAGPKKHALELLRKKIETQNERVACVRAKHTAAKATFEKLDAELRAEEAAKEQLCGELNTLVQQAAKAQLDKLEELKATLEGLYGGIMPRHGAGPQQQQQVVLTACGGAAAGPPGAAAGKAAQEQQQGGAEPSGSALPSSTEQAPATASTSAAAAVAAEEHEQLRRRQEQAEREERERRVAEERRRREAEAAAARSRHVSLGSAPGGSGREAEAAGARPGGGAAVAATAAAPTGRQTGGSSPGRAAAGPGPRSAGPAEAAAAARPKAASGGATSVAAGATASQRFAGFDT